MPLGSLSLYILYLLLTGYTVTLVVSRGRLPWSTIAAMSIALGGGATAFLLFYLDLIGLRPGRGAVTVIAAVDALVILSLFCLARFSRVRDLRSDVSDSGNAPPQSRFGSFHWPDLLALIPLALACYVLYVVWLQTTRVPMEWDAWCFWLYKAKILAAAPLFPKPEVFSLASFSYAHPGYPALWPFLGAGAYGVTLTRDDHTARTIQWVLYAGLLLTLYVGLRWKTARLPAMSLAALGIAVPSMIHWAGVGYGDVLLAGFYAGMVYFVARWIETREKRDLIFAALFAAAGAFTKNEGLPLGLISLAIVLVSSIRSPRAALAKTALFAGVFLIPLVPWFLYIHGAPPDSEDYSGQIRFSILWKNLSRVPTIASAFWREWINWEHWGPLWPLLIVGAVMGFRAFRKPAVIAMWTMLVLHILLYGFIFIITTWKLEELIPVSLERLLTHLVPAVILLIGWHAFAAEPGRIADA